MLSGSLRLRIHHALLLCMLVLTCLDIAWYVRADDLTELADPTNTRMLIVLHRHGIREPGIYNPFTKVAEWDLCQLREKGAEQLHTLGTKLAQTYGNVLGTNWDIQHVTSFSTKYPRTQQSAQAFLRGIYPSEVAPTVLSLEPPTSNFALPMTLPSMVLHMHKKKAESAMNADFETQTTPAERKMLDRQMHTEEMCQTRASGALCFITYIDYLRYAEAMGIDPPAIAEELTDKLIKLWRMRNQRLFAWILDAQFQKEYIPSLGAPLAQLLLKYMRAKEKKLLHFSVHDETLTALYHVLGLIAADDPYCEYNEVGFGEAIVVEVRNDDTMVVMKGKPDYPDVAYQFQTLAIDCGGGSRQTVCSVEKWAAVVEKLSPKDPLACHASPSDHMAQGCTASTGATPTPACIAYRRSCPQFGCLPNTISEEYVVDLGEPATLPCRFKAVGVTDASKKETAHVNETLNDLILRKRTSLPMSRVTVASFVFFFLLLLVFVLILLNRKKIFKDKVIAMATFPSLGLNGANEPDFMLASTTSSH